MSRFADPRRTATLALPGGCQCPGSPHEDDEWTYRTELGNSEILQAGARAMLPEGGVNVIAMQDVLLEVASVRWNLVDDAGAVPADAAHFRLLDETTRNAMLAALDEATAKTVAPVPNASGARSPNGSRASASRTRTHPTGK